MDRLKPSGGGVWALFACQLFLLAMGGLGAHAEEVPGTLDQYGYLQMSQGPGLAFLLLTLCLGLALLSLAVWHRRPMDFALPFFSIVMIYRCCWGLAEEALWVAERVYFGPMG